MRVETKHSFILLLGTGTTAALSLIYTLYVFNVLGAERAADFSAALSLFALCQMALGPINGTVARFSAKYAADGSLGKIRMLSGEVAKRVILYGAGAMVVAVLLVRPLATILRYQSVVPLLIAFGMLYLIMPLAVARGVLRGVQRFGHYNVNIVSEAAVRLAVGLLILSLVPEVAAALSAYVLALVATLLVSAVQLASIWRGHERQPVDGREIRRFTTPMFVMLMTTAGFQNLDMLMVKSFHEPFDAGIYSAAFRLSATIGVLATGFNTQLLPLMTGLYEQARAVAGPFIRLCGYFLLLTAIPIILFSLWPREILVALQLREYEAAAPLLAWLTLARVLSYVSHMIALAGAAMNDFRFLWVYVPGLLAMAAALAIWQDSLQAVVLAVLSTQGATLLALIVFVALRRIGGSRRAPSLQGDQEQEV